MLVTTRRCLFVHLQRHQDTGGLYRRKNVRINIDALQVRASGWALRTFSSPTLSRNTRNKHNHASHIEKNASQHHSPGNIFGPYNRHTSHFCPTQTTSGHTLIRANSRRHNARREQDQRRAQKHKDHPKNNKGSAAWPRTEPRRHICV